jgi:glycerol-3-phosphate acyltransferase PlsY
MPWLFLVLAALIGYALGSVAPGLLLGKVLRGIDIREHGSGKTGATNVQRTLGWGPAALTFAVDILKGTASVYAARLVTAGLDTPWPEVAATLAGLAAIAGHNWSVFLGWRGGRGMSPALGAALALQPLAGGLGLLVGVMAVVLTDMVSVGSIVGTLVGLTVFGIGAVLGWAPAVHVLFGAVASGMVLVSHLDNMQRILRGEERKLGLRGRAREVESSRR